MLFVPDTSPRSSVIVQRMDIRCPAEEIVLWLCGCMLGNLKVQALSDWKEGEITAGWRGFCVLEPSRSAGGNRTIKNVVLQELTAAAAAAPPPAPGWDHTHFTDTHWSSQGVLREDMSVNGNYRKPMLSLDQLIQHVKLHTKSSFPFGLSLFQGLRSRIIVFHFTLNFAQSLI